jgi:hypothetical protein
MRLHFDFQSVPYARQERQVTLVLQFACPKVGINRLQNMHKLGCGDGNRGLSISTERIARATAPHLK